MSKLTVATRIAILIAALGLLAILALWAPGGSGSTLPGLALTDAEAAQCKGASRSPKRLGKKRARSLVVCLVNKQRSKAGVRRVKKKAKVAKAATRHTKQMKKTNCLGHVCPGEPSLVGRLEKTKYLPCRCSWGVGENIGWGMGRKQGSPRAMVAGWMRSGIHRSTMLSGAFEHVGVGYRRGGPTTGSKNAATYTIDFGFKR